MNVHCFLIALMLFSQLSSAGAVSVEHDGNGGTRGGGDNYSAEVFFLARGVARKLRVWTREGILRLTEEQIERVEAIVDLDEKTDGGVPLLEIYSFERVYKHPELLPSGDADETTLINIYAHVPPRIEVGRIRWDGLKGKNIEKEMLVLHELLGAAGLLEHGQRIDDQFFHSYELKLHTLEAWETFKDKIRMRMIGLAALAPLSIRPDLSHFSSFASSLENLPQYDKARHPERYVSNRKEAAKLASNSYDEIQTWVQKSLPEVGKAAQEPNRRVTDLANAQREGLRSELIRYTQKWANWGASLFNRYNRTHAEVIAVMQKELSANSVYSGLQKTCGDSGVVPFAPLLECWVRFIKTDYPERLDAEADRLMPRLNEGIVQSLDSLASAVSPDDLP